MKAAKRKKLESAGWRVGTVAEFLGLTDVEALIVEMRIALSQELKRRRTKRHLTQKQLGLRIESSPSRVSKMEAADPTVSLDLLVRGLAATGATKHDVAKLLRK